jgi:Tol biopolymer transport system component
MNGHGMDPHRATREGLDGPTVSDRALEDVFALRAAAGAVGGLRSSVLAATALTSQRRRLWVLPRLVAWDGPPGRRQLALLFALTALAALLIAVALAALSSPHRGDRLAFLRDGDVYVANGDGSGSVRVLHEDGTPFSNPAWSPDGAWLAADSTGGAVVMNVATQSIRRIGGTNPAWSPIGSEIAVRDEAPDGAGVVRIVSPVTGSTSHSYPVPGPSFEPLAWSPNGHWIALTGSDPAQPEGANALLRLDVTTGAVVQIDPTSGHLDAPRSPSWSPTSSQIAFIRYRGCERMCTTDVYVADANGANPLQINEVRGTADEPAWSPDGRWLAFRSSDAQTRGIAGVMIGGPAVNPRNIVAGWVDAFAWKPTSDGLVYSIPDPSRPIGTLWEASLDGAHRQLAGSIDTPTFGAAVTFALSTARAGGSAPELPTKAAATPGPTVAIGSAQMGSAANPGGSWGAILTDGDCSLRRIDLRQHDSATLAHLCDPPDSHLSAAAWSPTGASGAAFVETCGGETCVNQLLLVRLDGVVAPALTDPTGQASLGWSADGQWLFANDQIMRPDGSTRHTVHGPVSWSPDGRRLAVWLADGTLQIGYADGSGLRAIGTFPPPEGWLPDGSRFGFVRAGDAWTVATDGSDLRNVSAFRLGGASRIAWSPDGRWLAVEMARGTWIMRPDGSDRLFLDFGPHLGTGAVAWSPDGSHLAVETYPTVASQSGIDNGNNVVLIAVEGWTAVQILDAIGPTWSPDGRFLLVSKSSGSELDVMNADGSGRWALTGSEYRPGALVPAWIR